MRHSFFTNDDGTGILMKMNSCARIRSVTICVVFFIIEKKTYCEDLVISGGR